MVSAGQVRTAGARALTQTRSGPRPAPDRCFLMYAGGQRFGRGVFAAKKSGGIAPGAATRECVKW